MVAALFVKDALAGCGSGSTPFDGYYRNNQIEKVLHLQWEYNRVFHRVDAFILNFMVDLVNLQHLVFP